MRLLARILGPMPFARLSATHTVCNFADSFFAVSLAGIALLQRVGGRGAATR